MGNLLMQAKAAGLVKNKEEIRRIVRNSTEMELFEPSDTALWNDQYQRYLEVYQEI
jgi:rhamnulokinase